MNGPDAVHWVISMATIKCNEAKSQVGKIENVELFRRVERISALSLVEAVIKACELVEAIVVDALVVDAKELQFRP
ncbi:hypothetical protein RU07_18445 [Agrobacterium tumefaciens]|uniref:Uncharacterized protein n=1 Tax=Agrobacterium tumefaciens TaxID=358 RepID=A0A0D0KRP3_AGRTU|nr:hypothetical protein RU07_18445 [Agrobacterium tumefaciens]